MYIIAIRALINVIATLTEALPHDKEAVETEDEEEVDVLDDVVPGRGQIHIVRE